MLPAPTVPGGLQSMTGMSMSYSWAKDWLNRLHAQARSALALLAACLALTASGASAAPIITVAGTCDTLANSTFTITNIGTAMTVNYTWELYQNSVFLTSGPFLLTAAGTAGDHQVLTINGLFGVIEVRVKDQNGAQLANASATCVERPRVTINKAAGQADPANALPIMFTAVFSRAVTGFTASDLVITGMANTPIVTLTDSGDHRNFSIAIDGVRDLETVRVTIPQDAAQAVNDGLGNFASTSNDNTVVYQAPPVITVAGTCDASANSQFAITNIGGAMSVNYTWELYQNSVFLTSGPFLLTAAGTAGDHQVLTINGLFGVIEVRVKDQNGAQLANASATCVERPRVTINKAAGQADPANALPIMFTAVFSRAVTGFTASDLVITGMANTPIVTLTDSGDHRNFSIAIDGVRDLETVRVTIPQDAAQAVNDGLGNFASTSNDNTVVYQAPPVITVAGTCDASANSQFAITNIGGAMSVNYTWELYQNSVFLTSGPFLLTAAGTPGATQVLTINGLYGVLTVRIKSNTGVEVANATATCQPLSVTINQAAAQTDPASTSPINFDVVFSAPVNGFINTDVVISGMAAAPGVTVTDSGDHRHFTVAVTGAASGETIRASIPASVATDRSTSSFNTASTSTDNSVTFDTSRMVTAIVVDAVNPQIVTAALYGSGIWRSTNGGNAWVAATTQPGNLWLTALLVDPANGTRYYTASRGGGVYKSANAGTTWAACGSTGLGSLRINSMAMNATGTLFAGTEAGVFKSNDCGNWSIANSGLPVATTMPVTALLPDPLAANTLYAGVDGAGIYRTVTGGTAWTAVAVQPANLRVTALAIKPAAVATLYAATMGGGVFVSADSGTSWSACAALPGSANTLSLSIDALGTLVAGTESGVALSGDGCASWSSITAGWTGSGPQATGQGPLKFTAVAQAQDAARTLHAGNRSGTVQHTDLPPVLAAAAVSGTTQTTTTLTATSRETGKGEWIVIARNAQAPTFAQVKAAAPSRKASRPISR